MTLCLYCSGTGPFSTVEHVVPESLGNGDLTLSGCVCDACQSYFGKEIEQFVLEKTPLAVWRTLLGIRTKKGRLPAVDSSQPHRTSGKLPDTHANHDNLRFAAHPDGSTSVDIDDDSICRELADGSRGQFRLALTPKKLSTLGRFLGKVGLGVLAVSEQEEAYGHRFDAIRRYARFGSTDNIWPLFHYSAGGMGGWRKPTLLGAKGEPILEEVELYSYGIVEVGGAYTLFRFSMGSDNWIITLDDPFPSPVIRAAFPGRDLQLIWYAAEEWNFNQAMQRTRDNAGR